MIKLVRLSRHCFSFRGGCLDRRLASAAGNLAGLQLVRFCRVSKLDCPFSVLHLPVRQFYCGPLAGILLRKIYCNLPKTQQLSYSSESVEFKETMRRRLLPLTALRAFETAARLLSFNKAAEELGVTTSAVSRQVATLEELIGAPLFIRGVRHIALTDDGRELQKIVFRSLDDIDRGLEDLMARARERATQVTQLRVRLLTTLATRLVLPHLARLEAEHADLQVLLTVASNSEDRREAACDLSIGYSRVAPSEGEEILFPDEAVPVCAPHYLANLDVAAPPSADRLLALRLLGSTRDLWDWRIWARHAGA
ncbi:MAG TPA: LysR family transcriptional regulator, partial [Microvirga sp.]|nr:LysR family transcriptional regulator [Microvirga sp.]